MRDHHRMRENCLLTMETSLSVSSESSDEPASRKTGNQFFLNNNLLWLALEA